MVLLEGYKIVAHVSLRNILESTAGVLQSVSRYEVVRL